MPYKDPTAQKAAQKHWYLKNKISIAERKRKERGFLNEKKAASRNARRAKINLLKEKNCCLDCHEFYPAYVMDFDHVRGEKIGNVGMMINSSASWNLILEEIDKCDIICSNCHRIRHHKK